MRFPPFATLFGLLVAVSIVLGYVNPKESQPGLGIYPEVAPFTAVPASIRAGEPATLKWASRGAVSVSLEAIPEGRPEGASELRGLPPAGTITVQPRETTVYRMRCETAFSGTACAGIEARIDVRKVPAIPQTIESGFGGN